MQKTDYKNLAIESSTAENILFDAYQIRGNASLLPGEYDLNFKIRVDHKDQYVLKISRPDADPEALDFQQKLLKHVQESPEKIKAPIAIKDKASNLISTYIDGSGRKRPVRLLSLDSRTIVS